MKKKVLKLRKNLYIRLWGQVDIRIGNYYEVQFSQEKESGYFHSVYIEKKRDRHINEQFRILESSKTKKWEKKWH